MINEINIKLGLGTYLYCYVVITIDSLKILTMRSGATNVAPLVGHKHTKARVDYEREGER